MRGIRGAAEWRHAGHVIDFFWMCGGVVGVGVLDASMSTKFIIVCCSYLQFCSE